MEDNNRNLSKNVDGDGAMTATNSVSKHNGNFDNKAGAFHSRGGRQLGESKTKRDPATDTQQQPRADSLSAKRISSSRGDRASSTAASDSRDSVAVGTRRGVNSSTLKRGLRKAARQSHASSGLGANGGTFETYWTNDSRPGAAAATATASNGGGEDSSKGPKKGLRHLHAPPSLMVDATSPVVEEEVEMIDSMQPNEVDRHVDATIELSNTTNGGGIPDIAAPPGAFSIDGILTSQSLQAVEPLPIPSPPQSSQAHLQNQIAAATEPQLVTAREVAEGDDPSMLNLPMADEFDKEQKDAAAKRLQQKENAKTVKYGVAGLLAVVAVVLLVVLLVVDRSHSGNSKEEGLTASPATSSPTTQQEGVESRIINLLPRHTLEQLNVQDSPQSLAYHWIMNDAIHRDYSDDRLLQRFVLATLFYATSGNNTWYKNQTIGWLTDAHECDWAFGASNEYVFYDRDDIHHYWQPDGPCTEANNSSDMDRLYEHIWLPDSGLQGELPPELFLLSSLRVLTLFDNHLEGRLSSHIGQLTNLEVLALSATDLSGSLPAEITSCTNLEAIVLTGVQFSGILPTVIGSMDALKFLWLGEMALKGSIPSELGLLTNLEILYLEINELGGKIPTELGLLENLRDIELSRNMLTGSLPSQLAQLSDSLIYGRFFENQLSGTLPSEIGQLDCHELYLRTNHFTGLIPSELALLTSMADLSLRENNFSGAIPSELGLLDEIRFMWLQNNKLNGTIPTSILSMPHLEGLVLSHNLLEGPISSVVGEMYHLVELDLSGNGMAGSIPTQLGLLGESLGTLSLGENLLSGQIPSQISNLGHLKILYLYENKLNGPLPPGIGNLSYVFEADLSGNDLNGTLPTTLGQLDHMEALYLSHNHFSGMLPSEFGNMEHLHFLTVAGNALTGNIPEELAITLLHELDLSENDFTGKVPSVLCALGADLFFDCSNTLCGCSCSCGNNSGDMQQ